MPRAYNSIFSPRGIFTAVPGGDKAVFIPEGEAKQKGYSGKIPVPNAVISPVEKLVEDWKEYWGIEKKKKKKGPEEIKPPALRSTYRVGFDDEFVRSEFYRRMQFYRDLEARGISIERTRYPDDQLGLAKGRKIYVKEGLDSDTEAAVVAHELGHVMGEDSEDGAYTIGYKTLEQFGLYRAASELERIEKGDSRLN